MALRIITRTLLLSKSIKPTPNFSTTTAINSTHLSNLFLSYGFPPSDLPTFLTKNQFLLNSSLSNLQSSLNILSSFFPSNNSLISILHNFPKVLQLDFLKNCQSAVSKLGFTDPNLIHNLLQASTRFNLHPDDVLQSINCLKGFRFTSVTIARVLQDYPLVITMNEDQIWGKVEFLLGIGIHRTRIDSVLQIHPGILGLGVESKLKPLVSELVDMGFKPNEIRVEIVRNPRILNSEVGELSKCFRMLKTLKCRVPIKEKIFSDGALRACYMVKLRIDLLHQHGLSYREAFSVLWREPRVMLYDLDEIDNKIEFLTKRMRFDVACLVDVPEYLGVHFEKQIVPRYSVIECLRCKGGLGDEVGLRSLVKFSRLRFYNLYVKPYPECEKIYGRFVDVKVRRGHPEGLWKLFKPPKYSDSKKDLKNIRSFMEQLH